MILKAFESEMYSVGSSPYKLLMSQLEFSLISKQSINEDELQDLLHTAESTCKPLQEHEQIIQFLHESLICQHAQSKALMKSYVSYLSDASGNDHEYFMDYFIKHKGTINQVYPEANLDVLRNLFSFQQNPKL